MKLKKAVGLAAILICGLVMVPGAARATAFTWNVNASGDWNVNANWDPNTAFPNSSADTATINHSGTKAITVTLPNIDDTTGTLISVGPLQLGDSTNTNDAINIQKNSRLDLFGNVTNYGTIKVQNNGQLVADVANVLLGNGGSGSVAMSVGSTLGATDGSSFINDANHTISGAGTISAPLTNNGTITASGATDTTQRTLIITGDVTNNTVMNTAGANNTLDLRSTITGGSINPNGGSVIMKTATLQDTTLGAGEVSVQSGTGNELRGTTNSAANISVNNSSTLKVYNALKGTGNISVNDTAKLNVNTTGQVLAANFTMSQGATLQGTHLDKGTLVLSGNFSFQQTDPTQWANNPNLKMTGGTELNPVTLEVGGVNGNGLTNNFALNTLTIGEGAYVQLVDLYNNAGTAGSEVLYIGSLLLGGAGDPTLDLNNIMAYVMGPDDMMMALGNGDYNGITIVGAAVPLPPGLLLLGSGLLGLAGWRRLRKS